jgi:hypothetical protein
METQPNKGNENENAEAKAASHNPVHTARETDEDGNLRRPQRAQPGTGSGDDNRDIEPHAPERDFNYDSAERGIQRRENR